MSDDRRQDFATAGVARGTAVGDVLAGVLASPPPNLRPDWLDAFRLEALGMAYEDVRQSERALIATGASEDDATLFRMGAVRAIVERLRLADRAFAASGPAN